MDEEQREVGLSDTTMGEIGEVVASAVKQAITESMNTENAKVFWVAGIEVLQQQASEHAGKFVLGGLMGLVRKTLFFLIAGGMIYALGGWSALAAFFKAIFGSGSN